jgi:hypothetical protein
MCFHAENASKKCSKSLKKGLKRVIFYGKTMVFPKHVQAHVFVYFLSILLLIGAHNLDASHGATDQFFLSNLKSCAQH